MTTVNIDGTFDVEVNQHWPMETLVHIRLFGSVVHTERYPKYLEGDKLETAIADAKRRFTVALRSSLKQLETV